MAFRRAGGRRMMVWAIMFLLVDILTKFFAKLYLMRGSKVLIQGFFSLTYAENRGAAFSILHGKQHFLIAVTTLVLVLTGLYVFRMQDELSGLERLAAALFFSGAIGNLLDRVLRGYVIDFFSFSFGSYHFPIFNFADMCITFAVIIFLWSMVRGGKAI